MQSNNDGIQRNERMRIVISGALLALLITPNLAQAQTSETLNGAPVQVTPAYSEPGVPMIAIPQGKPTTLTQGSGANAGGASTASGSDALDTMLGQSWGTTAISNAQALGLNPSALAAECVIESGCGANLGSGTGAAQGDFQMQPAAFQDGLQTALAVDPSLASQIMQGSAGMDDPTTEAIAASGYLIQANQSLESSGISNPTVLDTRSYYEFGPTYSSEIASSSTSAPLSSILPSSYLLPNGISVTETISQWQSSVSSRIGNAANQTVLG